MKQLQQNLLGIILTATFLAFALGFVAGLEARHRNDVNLQEARGK